MANSRGNHVWNVRLSRRLAETTLGRAYPTTPSPGSDWTRTEIREGTSKLQVDTKGSRVHVDRADEVTVAANAATAARPSSALGLVCMSTPRTPAAGASFGAGRARDASLFRFVGQIVDVTAVFPLRHTPIVAPAAVPVAHAVWVAD
jgi:hypothetical protein